jgi:SAM-dependent methyltransferase
MALDEKYYEVAPPGSWSERLLIRARDRIYADFLAACLPQPSDTILDVGVSDVLNDGANLLERLYPRRGQIIACGLGEAKEFRSEFPEIRYRQIAPAPLPFPDKSFDIAFSNAVLEHVGGLENQRRFVADMARVARRLFISVPHRFFPVEHHTAIPIAHWTDATFRLACALTGKRKWSREDELTLMSSSRLRSVVPVGVPHHIGYTGLRLGPFSSNLYLVVN